MGEASDVENFVVPDNITKRPHDVASPLDPDPLGPDADAPMVRVVFPRAGPRAVSEPR